MGKKSNTKLTRNFIKDILITDTSDRVTVFDSIVRGFAMVKFTSGRVSFFIEVKTEVGKRRKNFVSFSNIREVRSIDSIRKRAEYIILSIKTNQV